MSNDALMVFTAKPTNMIHEQGGTSSWVLSATSMRDVRYVVCTRNSDRTFDEECGPRTEPHGSAFLVGKVSGLKQVGERNGRKRYLVQMSEYARVMVPDFWTHDRNPTRYTDTDNLRERGIDVEKLDWLPMPGLERHRLMPIVEEEVTTRVGDGLSIAEAKHGLAVRFGVPEDAIQIVING